MTSAAWIFDGDASRLPRGLLLIGAERVEDDVGRAVFADVDALDVADLLGRLGVEDATAAALSWQWRTAEGDDVTDAELAGFALVRVTDGARVPLADVPALMGRALGDGFLRARGYLHADSAGPAAPLPVLIDVPEAARILGLSEAALRSRISKGNPPPGIIREGRGAKQRIRFHRERLLAGLARRAER